MYGSWGFVTSVESITPIVRASAAAVISSAVVSTIESRVEELAATSPQKHETTTMELDPTTLTITITRVAGPTYPSNPAANISNDSMALGRHLLKDWIRVLIIVVIGLHLVY